MKRSLLLVAVCVCLISLSFNANAAVIEAIDYGWYNEQGQHIISNPNTLTGTCCFPDERSEYRSYFMFDISSISGSVTTATFQMGVEATLSDEDFESATLWDVSSSHLPLLDTENGSGSGTSIFADLGTGATYGTFTLSTPGTSATNYPPGTKILNISLNSSAIAEINASTGGLFAIGVSLDEISTPGFLDEWIIPTWGEDPSTQLLVTSETPLPVFPLEIFMPPILHGGNKQPPAP